MDENISVVDPVASAEAGYSVPEASTSMDFSGLFGSMFGFNNYNSENMQELMNQYMQFVRDNTDYNNAWSAEQAQKQMDFQTMSQQMAQMFNSEEAAKNRDWQKMMSDTAHQREIADLKAAGLNPVLSAMGGNGAAVTSGASASSQAMSGAKGDGDQSMNGAITSILGSALNVMTNLASKSLDAQTSLAVAEKYTEMQRIVESMREEYSTWEHQNYPSGMYEAVSAVLHAFGLGNYKQNLDNYDSGDRSLGSVVAAGRAGIEGTFGILRDLLSGKKVSETDVGSAFGTAADFLSDSGRDLFHTGIDSARGLFYGDPDKYYWFWRNRGYQGSSRPDRKDFGSDSAYEDALYWYNYGAHSWDGHSTGKPRR